MVPHSPAVEKQLVNPRAVRYHHDPNDLVSLAAQVYPGNNMILHHYGNNIVGTNS